MLQHLFIRNYAIIDSLKIDFTSKLNIITGETGAGKSILMGALGLILGDRADTTVLLDKEGKCVVEGHFKPEHKEVNHFLKRNDLDEGESLIIRREISSAGKSRAFVNDTPVTLIQLKELADMLVDLHRQFDTQNLNQSGFQLQVLDALAGNAKLLSDYHLLFEKYKSVRAGVARLQQEQSLADKTHDYNNFLFEELDQASFRENEIEDIEAELKLMSHAENIKDTLNQVTNTFTRGESPMVQELRAMMGKIDGIREFVPDMAPLAERLKSSWIELKDIADELEAVNESISFSEQRLQELNERMDLAYTLLKKHGVQSTSELLKIKVELESALQKANDLTEEIERLKKMEIEFNHELTRIASQLSKKRREQSPSFTKKVNQLLQMVGMPNAAFRVNITNLDTPSIDGMDAVEFLFNANKTEFQPLSKVASGGELSRLMLIIKSMVAGSMQLPTLIFDEIDTGISGEAAKQVGNIIKELSLRHQILLITHQPQIAAKAFTHFYVFKEKRNGKILTGIRQLNEEERIEAIATMLSGEKPTVAAFENAREMMN